MMLNYVRYLRVSFSTVHQVNVQGDPKLSSPTEGSLKLPDFQVLDCGMEGFWLYSTQWSVARAFPPGRFLNLILAHRGELYIFNEARH